MESRMPEFREFVNKYPLIREEVRKGTKTWQAIYEEWVIYGDNDREWEKYRTAKEEVKTSNNLSINIDSVKNVIGYIKKINPDDLNKTLNTIQKVVQIAQTVSGSKTGVAPIVSSAFSDWWD